MAETKNKLIKCEFCDEYGVADRQPILHKFDCPENKLSKIEWDKERLRRDAKIAEFLLRDLEYMKKVEKMSYTELKNYLIDNIWYKMKICTLDEMVIDRVIDILDELASVNEKINNDIKLNL